VELPPARILVVDDIEENLLAMEALLRRLEVEVVLAQSGNEALERLLEQDFALALLDVNMPEMDGVQLAELMRGSQRTKHVPIIFVTAAYEPQRMFQGYDAGAFDFLFKPVDPKILLSKVKMFITLHDQQRQLALQLVKIEEVSARLAESLRLHETFVAALNHDLRTPLHTISLGTQMLQGALVDAGQRAIVERVANATERMSAMLDQLYDVARTRLGDGLPLERSHADLRRVVESVLRELELRRGERQFELCACGDASGLWDLPRISRVTANLIGNAVTHGPARGTIRVEVDGSAAEEVQLRVHNGGQIAADVLPRIFEPFRRGGRSGHGLGLGLYIVREITVAHGGTVTVSSTAERGTTFVVTLPRRPVDPGANGALPAPA